MLRVDTNIKSVINILVTILQIPEPLKIHYLFAKKNS